MFNITQILRSVHTVHLYVWYGFWWANVRERHHSADLSVHGRMILKWNLKEIRLGRRRLDSSGTG